MAGHGRYGSITEAVTHRESKLQFPILIYIEIYINKKHGGSDGI